MEGVEGETGLGSEGSLGILMGVIVTVRRETGERGAGSCSEAGSIAGNEEVVFLRETGGTKTETGDPRRPVEEVESTEPAY